MNILLSLVDSYVLLLTEFTSSRKVSNKSHLQEKPCWGTEKRLLVEAMQRTKYSDHME